MNAQAKLISLPGPRRTRGKTRSLCVLPAPARPVHVKLHLDGGVLEFRPKGTQKPFRLPLAHIWEAYQQNIGLHAALDSLRTAAQRVEDSRQLVFGREVLPALPTPDDQPLQRQAAQLEGQS